MARLRALVLIGLGFVVALSGCELLLRLARPDLAPRTATLAMFWRHDDWTGWSHVPSSRGPFRAFGAQTLVVTNSHGYRDRERSYEPPPGTRRIVVLGDSMVWGYGVPQDDIFTALLERRRAGLEVINLGVAGYGTDQELLVLERTGVRYRPDVVIVVFMENDFATNVERTAYFVYHKPLYALGADGSVTLTNVPVPLQPAWKQAASWLMRHWYTLNLASGVVADVRVRRQSARAAPDPLRRPPFPRDPSETLTAALLLEMDRVARANGAVFVVAVADRLGLRGLEIQDYLGARGIRSVSLEPAFPPERSRELHLQDGVHWSSPGHEAVADRLYAYMLEQQLLPEDRR